MNAKPTTRRIRPRVVCRSCGSDKVRLIAATPLEASRACCSECGWRGSYQKPSPRHGREELSA